VGWGEGLRDHAARVRTPRIGWVPSGRDAPDAHSEGTGPATPPPTPRLRRKPSDRTLRAVGLA